MKNNFLKKVSYNPFFVKAARVLHLRGILRKGYYILFHPKDNVLKVDFFGVLNKFFVKSPDELRIIESVVGDEGEKKVLNSLCSLLNAGDVVYDIGANIGIFSIILAKKVGPSGKIIAFEPEKESLVKLKDNIGLNNLTNIEIVGKALGETTSSGKLYISGTTGNFSLVNIYDKTVKSEDIEIVNGDDFVVQNGLPIPKAIKVDVEGYEYSVINGLKKTLTNPECKIICCEVHVGLFPQGITEGKVIELIKSFGFGKIDTFKRGFSAYHIIAQKK
ncbi:MAG: FkbM family methyltransferase [Candidatus Staskawiczbacteria bacterium]|nr:FkbM family methyltransferase [Candidatus Staskawiczbacteria bacterium]